MAKRIVRKMPAKGSKFTKKYKGKTYTLEVDLIQGDVVFNLGTNSFKSPSGAAKSINGGNEVNGWRFWGME
jgi:hypothetical protein